MVLSRWDQPGPGVPLAVEQGSAQEVAELALLDDRELAQARRRLGQPVEQAHSQGGALLGEHQGLDPPVAGGRPALDQAAVAEPVDDPGDVRGVAVEPGGQLARGAAP
jgi:hypothetical protein